MRKLTLIVLMGFAAGFAPALAQSEASAPPKAARIIIDPKALSGIGVVDISGALRRDVNLKSPETTTKEPPTHPHGEIGGVAQDRQARGPGPLGVLSVGASARVDTTTANQRAAPAARLSSTSSKVVGERVRAEMIDIPHTPKPAASGSLSAAVAGPARSAMTEHVDPALVAPTSAFAPGTTRVAPAVVVAMARPGTTPTSQTELAPFKATPQAQLASLNAIPSRPRADAAASNKSIVSQRRPLHAKALAAINRGRIVWGGAVH